MRGSGAAAGGCAGALIAHSCTHKEKSFFHMLRSVVEMGIGDGSKARDLYTESSVCWGKADFTGTQYHVPHKHSAI